MQRIKENNKSSSDGRICASGDGKNPHKQKRGPFEDTGKKERHSSMKPDSLQVQGRSQN